MLTLLSCQIFSSPPAPAEVDALSPQSEAGVQFWEKLGPEQRSQISFPLEHPERKIWSNLPTSVFPRQGLRLADLEPLQQEAVSELIATSFSVQGFQQIEAIRRQENQFPDWAGTSRDNYHLEVFGAPGSEPWAWQLDGHHLSLNVTITDDGLAMTPMLVGADTIDGAEGPWPVAKEVEHAQHHVFWSQNRRFRSA